MHQYIKFRNLNDIANVELVFSATRIPSTQDKEVRAVEGSPNLVEIPGPTYVENTAPYLINGTVRRVEFLVPLEMAGFAPSQGLVLGIIQRFSQIAGFDVVNWAEEAP